MTKLHPYAKAAVATIVGFVGAVAVGAVDNVVTVGEWWAAAATGTAAGAAVFGIRNRGA